MKVVDNSLIVVVIPMGPMISICSISELSMANSSPGNPVSEETDRSVKKIEWILFMCRFRSILNLSNQ